MGKKWSVLFFRFYSSSILFISSSVDLVTCIICSIGIFNLSNSFTIFSLLCFSPAFFPSFIPQLFSLFHSAVLFPLSFRSSFPSFIPQLFSLFHSVVLFLSLFHSLVQTFLPVLTSILSPQGASLLHRLLKLHNFLELFLSFYFLS